MADRMRRILFWGGLQYRKSRFPVCLPGSCTDSRPSKPMPPAPEHRRRRDLYIIIACCKRSCRGFPLNYQSRAFDSLRLPLTSDTQTIEDSGKIIDLVVDARRCRRRTEEAREHV